IFGPLDEEYQKYLKIFPEMKELETQQRGPSEKTLIGARITYPGVGGADWTCADEKHWIFAGTGMKNGDSIPGLVGWEYMGDPADIPGLRGVAKGELFSKKGS